MTETTSTIFETIYIEDGNQIIDVEEDMGKYDLLSLLFHRESIPIDTSKVIVVAKADNKRYFGDTSVCYKCGEIGHISRDCTQESIRRCTYCGVAHERKPCELILCDNCWKLGHTQRSCREKRSVPRKCMKCKTQLHSIDWCPKVWRRYRLLNTDVKEGMIMSCPLCLSTTHFIDDCKDKDESFSIFTMNYLDLIRQPNSTRKPK